MCKALDINPSTTKGRKVGRQKERGKQERKEDKKGNKGEH